MCVKRKIIVKVLNENEFNFVPSKGTSKGTHSKFQRTNADGEFDSNGGYYSLTYKDKEQDFIVKAGDDVGLRRLLMFAGGVHSSHIK